MVAPLIGVRRPADQDFVMRCRSPFGIGPKGYSLTKTVKTVPLPASVSEDIDYDQILVPIVG
ncbi:MAG TPA: hypothetical protein VIK32_05535, partial [Candidatus Limnocylindrales bacterium]